MLNIQYDPDKAALNPINHEGVTFEEAKPVLLDPYALTRTAFYLVRYGG